MTRRALSLFGATVIALIVPLSIVTSAAEITCNVPFSFVVAGRTLPAGPYMLSTESHRLIVRGKSNAAVVFTNTMQAQKAESRLVFDRIGDQYFLREAWIGMSGQELLKDDAVKSNMDRRTAATPVERVVIRAARRGN